MSLPIEPNITQGQIALDPVNGIVWYVDSEGNKVSTTWSWLRPDLSEIETDDNVTITGNLTVQGTTVTVDAETVVVEDNFILVNSTNGSATSTTAGIEVERGALNNVQIRWNEVEQKWQFTNDGITYLDISSIIENSVTLGLHTTGDYVESVTPGTGVFITQVSGESATPIISIGQDVSISATPTFSRVIAPITGDLTGNVIGDVTGNVTGDLNGNVTGNVTGDLSGNVTGNVTGNLTGDVTGYVYGQISDLTNHGINSLNDVDATPSNGQFLKWDGLSWINDYIDLTTDTVGDYVKNLVAGTGVTIIDNSGEGSTPNISIGQDVSTSATPVFGRVIAPLTGDVTGNVTGNVTGQVSDLTNHGINSLNDVDATPDSGQFLKWNGSSWVNDFIDLTTDTVGDYVQSLIAGTGVTLENNSGEGATPSISIGQDVSTTSDVTFNIVTADLVGDVTGTVSDISNHGISDLSDVVINDAANGDFLRYNGSNWINDPVNLTTDTVGDYVARLEAGTGILITNNSGEGSTPTISFNGSIDSVSDVVITNAANGETLIYNRHKLG